jgi:hypothetical protein
MAGLAAPKLLSEGGLAASLSRSQFQGAFREYDDLINFSERGEGQCEESNL